jgi:basic membrane protein A
VRVRRKTVAALAVTITALVAVAGLAGAGSATTGQATFLAGVVSDVGRWNDKSFNALALEGCKSGAKQVGGRCRALESRATSDYTPNLVKLQREGADIAVTVGFLLADATATIAKRFPNSKYGIVDYSVHAPPLANKKGTPLFKNVVGLTFATNENSYMIGCLSALMAKRDGGNTISAVGGISLPTVTIFIAAYRAGASKCVPGTKTLIDFSQDFTDQAKCKELALN